MAVMKQGEWQSQIGEDQLTQVDIFTDPLRYEPGRYHLYVSLACPFAHRALLVRSLMQLEAKVTVSI